MKGLIVYTLLKIKIHHKWQSSAMRILVRQIVKWCDLKVKNNYFKCGGNCKVISRLKQTNYKKRKRCIRKKEILMHKCVKWYFLG